MDRLLCCLLGFPEKDAQVLRSLTRLFRPSLTAEWAFEVGVTEGCDLLICDLDDPAGRGAWDGAAPPGTLRAAASAGEVEAGALLLRKPLRGHGASGIVQVLNAAAAVKRPEGSPSPPRPAPAVGTPPDRAAAPAPHEPTPLFRPAPAPHEPDPSHGTAPDLSERASEPLRPIPLHGAAPPLSERRPEPDEADRPGDAEPVPPGRAPAPQEPAPNASSLLSEHAPDPRGAEPPSDAEPVLSERVPEPHEAGPSRDAATLLSERVPEAHEAGPSRGAATLLSEHAPDPHEAGPSRGTATLLSERAADPHEAEPFRDAATHLSEHAPAPHETGPTQGAPLLLSERPPEPRETGPTQGAEALLSERTPEPHETDPDQGAKSLLSEHPPEPRGTDAPQSAAPLLSERAPEPPATDPARSTAPASSETAPAALDGAAPATAEKPRTAADADEIDAMLAAVDTPPEPPEPPRPAWASGAPPQAEPAQDEADIKDILRRMRFATIGVASEARTLLAALRGLRASSEPTVVEAVGLKPICVLPQVRAWVSTAQAAEIYRWLGDGNRPVRVLPFGSAEEARDAAMSKDEPVRPLEHLVWTASLRTPPERPDAYDNALFKLKRWPDLGSLPHEPHHMEWCGILTRQQAPMQALAGAAGVTASETAAFLEACGELGILERAEASAAEMAAVELPVISKKGRERISLFKNILGRLRIFRA